MHAVQTVAELLVVILYYTVAQQAQYCICTRTLDVTNMRAKSFTCTGA